MPPRLQSPLPWVGASCPHSPKDAQGFTAPFPIPTSSPQLGEMS